jgi:hypothetical protein
MRSYGKYPDATKKVDTLVAPLRNNAVPAEAMILLLPLDGTARSIELPKAWCGKIIDITPVGAAVKFHLHTVLTPITIDYGTAPATDGQADDPSVGRRIADGVKLPIQIPEFPSSTDMPGGTLNEPPTGWFFHWDGSGAGTELELVVSGM